MRDEDRRQLELARLATEVGADARALDTIARQCGEGRAGLAPPTRAAMAMVAVDLHRYYTAVENILERVERAVGALPTPGPSWHRDLLMGSTRALTDARPAILSPAATADLESLLAFRHFFRHAYVVDFDATRLDALVGRVLRVHEIVRRDVNQFIRHLESTIARLRSSQ